MSPVTYLHSSNLRLCLDALVAERQRLYDTNPWSDLGRRAILTRDINRLSKDLNITPPQVEKRKAA
jgi:hypothetical protein